MNKIELGDSVYFKAGKPNTFIPVVVKDIKQEGSVTIITGVIVDEYGNSLAELEWDSKDVVKEI